MVGLFCKRYAGEGGEADVTCMWLLLLLSRYNGLLSVVFAHLYAALHQPFALYLSRCLLNHSQIWESSTTS